MPLSFHPLTPRKVSLAGVPPPGTDTQPMTTEPSANPDETAAGPNSGPEWAAGLRQLYKAVVDEPLPDCFRDLLAQLDQAAADQPAKGTAGTDDKATPR